VSPACDFARDAARLFRRRLNPKSTRGPLATRHSPLAQHHSHAVIPNPVARLWRSAVRDLLSPSRPSPESIATTKGRRDTEANPDAKSPRLCPPRRTKDGPPSGQRLRHPPLTVPESPHCQAGNRPESTANRIGIRTRTEPRIREAIGQGNATGSAAKRKTHSNCQ
jgi:hypothetical protein